MFNLPPVIYTLAAAAAPVAEAVTEAPMPWHVQLVHWTLTLGLVVTCAGMGLCIYRLIAGPHIADRAISVDTMAIQLIALVILLSLKWETLMFFDGILVLSLVGFAGAVAMAQYIGRPHLKKKTQAATTSH